MFSGTWWNLLGCPGLRFGLNPCGSHATQLILWFFGSDMPVPPEIPQEMKTNPFLDSFWQTQILNLSTSCLSPFHQLHQKPWILEMEMNHVKELWICHSVLVTEIFLWSCKMSHLLPDHVSKTKLWSCHGFAASQFLWHKNCKGFCFFRLR